MLTIPWTSTKAPAGATLIQVSRLELRRARDVPEFLVSALRIRRAMLRAPGAVGVSLRAAPLSRTFWTLSTWTDRASIAAFVAGDEHLAVMQRYRGRMAGSHFHTWTDTQPTDHAPRWTEALGRFDATADRSS